MIQEICLQNFGAHREIKWDNLQKINVIVGENSKGKTFLLKALYSALKVLENSGKGDNPQSIEDELAEKLYWTFQVRKLGDLVKKNAEAPLSFSLVQNGLRFSYSFGKDTTKKLNNVETDQKHPSMFTTVFIPEKEVLSLYQVVLKSREQDHLFGFDDTYYDLVKELRIPMQAGRYAGPFSSGAHRLEALIDGNIDFDERTDHWFFKKGNTKYPVETVSEGIKKISIFRRLMANRYLGPGSVVLIDEPEASLHPSAIIAYMDILNEFVSKDVQIFLATHSYFVIKKLCMIARKNQMSVPFLSLSGDDDIVYDDMIDGMPDNSIINSSIRLYEEELDDVMGSQNL